MQDLVDRVRKALQFVPPTHPLEARGGELTTAIRSALGADGRAIWEPWIANSYGEADVDLDAVWRCAPSDGSITLDGLFEAARQSGWVDDQDGKTGAVAAASHEKRGLATKRTVSGTREKNHPLYIASKSGTTPHPYLERAQVSATSTLSELSASRAREVVGRDLLSQGAALEGRLLVVPIKRGSVCPAVQLIDEQGRKVVLSDGEEAHVTGHWATKPISPSESGVVLLGVDVVTVLSASQTSGYPGVAALAAENLANVADMLRDKCPRAKIIVLADLRMENGLPEVAALEVAAARDSVVVAAPDFGVERTPKQVDFNHLLLAHGPETVKRQIQASCDKPLANIQNSKISQNSHEPLPVVGAPEDGKASNASQSSQNSHSNTSEPAAWKAPQSLSEHRAPEPFPTGALPVGIRSAVEEVRGYTQAPVALALGSALAVLSLAVQAHVDVQRSSHLQGPVSLYLLSIADSGERKSTCDRFFAAPVREYETRQSEVARTAQADYGARMCAWEAQKSGLGERIRQETKDNKCVDDLKEALQVLERDRPRPPLVPHLVYQDATPEALSNSLANDWPSGGILSPEGGLVLGSASMSRESIMRMLSQLNTYWDGDPISIRRRTKESCTVHDVRLTIGFQIQEATLRSFFAQAKGLARGTGFLARFLVAWPESTQGQRFYEEPPSSWPHLAVFQKRITEILERPVPMDDSGHLTPKMLALTPEAKDRWIDFHNGVERRIAKGGELYEVRDIASKAADNAARLAALFHVFEHDTTGDIGEDAMRSACAVVEWYLSEAVRFLSEVDVPDEMRDFVMLDEWLIARCRKDGVSEVAKTDISKYGPRRLRKKALLDAALKELADLDRVRVETHSNRLTVCLNPELLKDRK
jgi:putative DNA primase/helicase